MARYVASVETSWDREQAFAYLAEFSNVSEWDPGIPRARALSADPLAVGARFEVVSKFMGREPAEEQPHADGDAENTR